MPVKHLSKLFLRLFIVLVFLFVLFPFIWCLLISLQSTPEVNSAYAVVLPTPPQIQNYLMVLKNSQFLEGAFNSFVIALISVAVNLLVSMPAGFALARVRTPFVRRFGRLLLLFMFVPIMLVAQPLQKMLHQWGLSGSHLMVALPMSALVMTTINFWAFYSRFPAEMDDCAILLGMTPIQGFFRIYLPVSGRMMAYAAILQFVTTWNCAFLPMFMYRGPGGLITIQEALLPFTLSPSRVFLGMVAVIFTCLPCWLLYILRDKIGDPAPHATVADPFRNSN